jgi:hypothetical protein
MGAPQLVLAACLDEDNQVVHCAGVMTAPELQRALQGDQAALNPSADLDELALSSFRGGAERLLTLVQLLNLDAISRDGLTVARCSNVVSVFDWLSEQLDQALQGLGGSLVPATAGRFRSAFESNSNALAMLSIPLGLEDGQRCSGAVAAVDEPEGQGGGQEGCGSLNGAGEQHHASVDAPTFARLLNRCESWLRPAGLSLGGLFRRPQRRGITPKRPGRRHDVTTSLHASHDPG